MGRLLCHRAIPNLTFTVLCGMFRSDKQPNASTVSRHGHGACGRLSPMPVFHWLSRSVGKAFFVQAIETYSLSTRF